VALVIHANVPRYVGPSVQAGYVMHTVLHKVPPVHYAYHNRRFLHSHLRIKTLTHRTSSFHSRVVRVVTCCNNCNHAEVPCKVHP